ncbi:cold-shock protein [Novosphingobium sp. KN65.2]|uniref:cold-shock protein n=1 Tax=Novosphingobium sp. KN65.2 TaxID=1478134 RepID=UPI0005E53C7A|nr:hypothetical protein [Novosphingobium sp. KN65.2]CDO38341.1 conserved hypothetical protein [Novosphingobium sp. KN65.2]
MTLSGKITSYDSAKGAGTITPEMGGKSLPFVRADLDHQRQAPKVGQRYGYETKQLDSGKQQAVNLQQQLSHREQAEQQQG